MTPPDPGIRVRLRTASDRKKQFAQYDELRRSGLLVRSVIIAEMKNGAMQVLGQGMSIKEIAQSLLIAADALVAVEKKDDEVRLRPELPADEVSGNVGRAGPAIPSILQKAADGTLNAPAGEAFITCGECGHTRWYALSGIGDIPLTRLACSRCGNEIRMIAVAHPEGHA